MKKQLLIGLLLALGTQQVVLPVQDAFTGSIESVTSALSSLKNEITEFLSENSGLKYLGSIALGAYALQHLVGPDKQEQKKGSKLYEALQCLELGALIALIPYSLYKTYTSDAYWQGFEK